MRRAAKVAVHIERELIRSEGRPPKTTFREFARAVYDSKLATWRENTRKSAENHIFSFLIPHFGEIPIDEITDEHWGRYVHKLRGKFPKRYLGNTRKYMRLIMKRAKNAGLTVKTLGLEIPREKKKTGKWYTKNEVERLLASSTESLQVQIMMAYLMGMRKMEVLALTWDRVDFDKGTIYLGEEHTKTKRAREIAIPPTLLKILRVRKCTASTPYVFPLKDGRRGHQRSNDAVWTRARTGAKVFGRFHDLRHSFLSELLLVNRENPLHVALYAGVHLKEIEKTYLHPNAETTRDLARSMRIRMPLRLAAPDFEEE